MRRKVKFLLMTICAFLLGSSVTSCVTSRKDAMKLEIAQKFASDSGESLEFVLENRSEFVDDYVEMKLWEEQKSVDMEKKQEETLNYLNGILDLSSADIMNLRSNRGLTQDNHDKMQNYVYEILNELSALSIEESEKIETVINTLFRIKELNYRDYDDYDFTVFMTNPNNLSDSQLYFVDSIRLDKWGERELMEDPNYIGKDDIYKIFVRIDELHIEGSNASAMVNVETNYLYPNGTVGAAIENYSVNLVNIHGKWLIDDIRDNSPKEKYFLENGIKIDFDKKY